MVKFNWRGRYQVSTVIVVVVVLVICNMSDNMWMLRQPYLLPQPPSTSHTSPNPDITPSDVDDPLASLDLRLGRWDSSRTFKTFDYAAVGDLYSEMSATSLVCLATQCSIDSLQEILKIAAHWAGPISLAVFVLGDEMRLLQAFVMWLIKCQPETYSRLALHVTTPSYRMAVFGTIPDWAQNCSAEPLFTKERTTETDEWKADHPYPQNILRNLARKNCHTPYVYMVDVDIVPSKGMAEDLHQFLSKWKCKLCAYVIPTYELDWSANFPSNKSELLQLVKKKLAVPFHRKVYVFNQLSSNLRKWEASRGYESNLTHVSHDVTNFRFAYEPFYVAPDSVPSHDERFLGYGFTRNSQVYEMFLLGYQFKVLTPIFTIHWGLQSAKTRPRWRMKQVTKNHKMVKIFKKELYVRYGKDPLHFFTSKSEQQNISNQQIKLQNKEK